MSLQRPPTTRRTFTASSPRVSSRKEACCPPGTTSSGLSSQDAFLARRVIKSRRASYGTLRGTNSRRALLSCPPDLPRTSAHVSRLENTHLASSQPRIHRRMWALNVFERHVEEAARRHRQRARNFGIEPPEAKSCQGGMSTPMPTCPAAPTTTTTPPAAATRLSRATPRPPRGRGWLRASLTEGQYIVQNASKRHLDSPLAP